MSDDDGPTYVEPRSGVPARHRLHPRPDHPRRAGPRARPGRGRAVAGGARPLPARRRAGLPVGEPGDHRPPPARPRGRRSRSATPGPTHDERSWTFDLDPDGRDPVLGIERLQEAFFARYPDYDRGDHGAGDRRRADRPGRHQRLPVDHPRPVVRVAGAPPPGRPRPVARGPARRDGRGDGAGLHRGQQRGLPLRLRRLAGVVRAAPTRGSGRRWTGSRSGSPTGGS